jgi:DNA-binding HxlR family transcriptional regulator
MGPPSDGELQPVAITHTGFILQLAMIENRSGCPINLALEALGDRWSLIVIRDIMFGNRRRFRELLTRSEEGIASNILAARLKRLVAAGVLSRRDDPAHRQKGIYSLTVKAIQLLPVLVQLGAWGRRHLPTSPELAVRQQVMEEGGPPLWSAFADELRHIHLETPLPEGRESVIARLQAAFEQAAADQRNEAAAKAAKNG